MELNFLNKLENKLFSDYTPNYQPVSGKLSVHALIGGFAISLSVFIMQMTSLNNKAIEAISLVLLLLLFAYIGKKCWPTIMNFPSTGCKIGFSAYMFFITLIAFYLAMWALIIALLLLIVYVGAKFIYGNNDPKKPRWKVRYEDGREVDAVETGRGICGERIIEDEDGKIHTVN